jgi:hypothetical protein
MSQSIVTGTKVEEPVQSTVQLITKNKQNFRISGLPGCCSSDGNFLHFDTMLSGFVPVQRDVVCLSSE